MTDGIWREATSHEVELAQAWLASWNAHTGDGARLGPDPVARASCDCGTCPSFEIRPLTVSVTPTTGAPLSLEGHASSRDGGSEAGLLAFAHEGSVDFEIYPYDDSAVVLEQLSFTFTSL